MAKVGEYTKEAGSRAGGCWPRREGGKEVRMGVKEDMTVDGRSWGKLCLRACVSPGIRRKAPLQRWEDERWEEASSDVERSLRGMKIINQRQVKGLIRTQAKVERTGSMTTWSSPLDPTTAERVQQRYDEGHEGPVGQTTTSRQNWREMRLSLTELLRWSMESSLGGQEKRPKGIQQTEKQGDQGLH